MGGLFSSPSNEKCQWVANLGRGDYMSYDFMSSSNTSKFCSRPPTADELAKKPADKAYAGGKRRYRKKTQKKKSKK